MDNVKLPFGTLTFDGELEEGKQWARNDLADIVHETAAEQPPNTETT